MKKGPDWVDCRTKRAIDLTLIIAALPLLILITALLSLIVIVFDGTWPIFGQERVGKGGRLFTLYKLNTMKGLVCSDSGAGSCDPRATGLGKLLRCAILDETPQLLINVLRGDMAIVGPRPLVPVDIALMRSRLNREMFCQWYDAYTSCKPGWTGQFGYYSRKLVPQSQQYLQTRQQQDILYRQTASFWKDFKIICVHFKLFYIDIMVDKKC